MAARAWAAQRAPAPCRTVLNTGHRRTGVRGTRQPRALGGGGGGSCGGGIPPPSEHQRELQSLQDRITAHQARLQVYVQAEDFDRAAAERDALMQLQLRLRQLELIAAAQQTGAVLHAIGTVIRHRRYGYRGVIAGDWLLDARCMPEHAAAPAPACHTGNRIAAPCADPLARLAPLPHLVSPLFPVTFCHFASPPSLVGHDPHCLADEAWIQQMRVDMLPSGREQPFYHVLVDERDRPGAQTTYVAQVGLGMRGRCSRVGAVGWGSEMAIRRAVWLGQSLNMCMCKPAGTRLAHATSCIVNCATITADPASESASVKRLPAALPCSPTGEHHLHAQAGRGAPPPHPPAVCGLLARGWCIHPRPPPAGAVPHGVLASLPLPLRPHHVGAQWRMHMMMN